MSTVLEPLLRSSVQSAASISAKDWHTTRVAIFFFFAVRRFNPDGVRTQAVLRYESETDASCLIACRVTNDHISRWFKPRGEPDRMLLLLTRAICSRAASTREQTADPVAACCRRGPSIVHPAPSPRTWAEARRSVSLLKKKKSTSIRPTTGRMLEQSSTGTSVLLDMLGKNRVHLGNFMWNFIPLWSPLSKSALVHMLDFRWKVGKRCISWEMLERNKT